MKIDAVDGVLQTGHVQSARQEEVSGNNEFGRILDETLNRASETSAGKAAGAQMISPLAALDAVLRPDVSTAVERTEKILDTLDAYRMKLEDPTATMKDLQPLVERMETEKESIAATLHSLPDGDGLKDILNRTMVDLSVEIVRFNRGDYV